MADVLTLRSGTSQSQTLLDRHEANIEFKFRILPVGLCSVALSADMEDDTVEKAKLFALRMGSQSDHLFEFSKPFAKNINHYRPWIQVAKFWRELTLNFRETGWRVGRHFCCNSVYHIRFSVSHLIKGPGRFAFTQELGSVQEGKKTDRQCLLRMAKYRFSALLLFPAFLVVVYLFEQYQ